MLRVDNLHFEYPEKTVLDHVSFFVKQGELLHLKGKNGAGKSTLLKLIAGLFYPGYGDIYFDQQSIKTDLADYHQKIAYLGHKSGLNQLLTVEEFLNHSLMHEPAADQLKRLVCSFGMGDLCDLPIFTLSAGQKRKVALIRALSSTAPLWLLDEPLVSLDDEAISVVTNALIEHLQQGGVVLMSSHQMIPLPGIDYQEYEL